LCISCGVVIPYFFKNSVCFYHHFNSVCECYPNFCFLPTPLQICFPCLFVKSYKFVCGTSNVPGRRLVRRIYIPLPDSATRKALIEHLLLKQGAAGAVLLRPGNVERIVALTEGYSGSDLTAVSCFCLRCASVACCMYACFVCLQWTSHLREQYCVLFAFCLNVLFMYLPFLLLPNL
jgi:hypothetical protein